MTKKNIKQTTPPTTTFINNTKLYIYPNFGGCENPETCTVQTPLQNAAGLINNCSVYMADNIVTGQVESCVNAISCYQDFDESTLIGNIYFSNSLPTDITQANNPNAIIEMELDTSTNTITFNLIPQKPRVL